MRGVWAAVTALALSCAHVPESPLPRYPTFAAALPRYSVSSVPYAPDHSRGRVVLVMFLATHCFPCLAELATVDRLTRDFAPRGLDVVLVGMDLEGRRVLEPFAAHYELKVPLVVGDDALRAGSTPFGRIAALPGWVLFGRDGRALAAWHGTRSWEMLAKAVEEALAERP